MSGFTLDEINLIVAIVIAAVTVSGLGPDAYHNLLAFWRRHTYRGNFKITAKTYSETTDLNQAIRNEFGLDYRLADWNEIKEANGGDVKKWVEGIGLEYGGDYFVTCNGQRFWNGNSGKRHYLVTRSDHHPFDGYGVHDTLENHLITLGSWYGRQNRAIAIKEPHKEAPR